MVIQWPPGCQEGEWIRRGPEPLESSAAAPVKYRLPGAAGPRGRAARARARPRTTRRASSGGASAASLERGARTVIGLRRSSRLDGVQWTGPAESLINRALSRGAAETMCQKMAHMSDNGAPFTTWRDFIASA